MKKQRK